MSVQTTAVTLLVTLLAPLISLSAQTPIIVVDDLDLFAGSLAEGEDAGLDKFEVIDSDTLAQEGNDSVVDNVQTKVLGASQNGTRYTNVVYKLPLQKKDYYYGKYINARAGANELNNIPTLTPGKRVRIIADGYISVWRSRGYVQPRGYYFGSGLCWSASALGGMLDAANAKFKAKYGLDLFVFSSGDRAPHSKYYATYAKSNRGRGYAVIKKKKGGQDLRFTVNPQLAKVAALRDIKIDINMIYSQREAGAYRGEMIGATLNTNKSF
jgi:hypothetical protein